MESNESEAATKASNLDEGAQDKILDTGNNTNYKLAMLSQMQPRSRFFFQTLFIDSVYSDVTIHMMGKWWKLHKKFLCQSPYFSSMFSGSWRESKEQVFFIDCEGLDITEYALFVILGSLYYTDELDFEVEEVLSVLAAASFFQIQDLIDKCEKLMKERIGVDTAVAYYNASVTHNIPSAKSAAFQWLEINLTHFSQHLSFLRTISVELMESLVWSKNLTPNYYESEFYSLLKNWLFTQLTTDDNEKINFFNKQEWKIPFLNAEVGKQFLLIFKALKIKYLLLETDRSVIETTNEIGSDNIIPQEWMYAAQTDILESICLISSSKDLGPDNISDDSFEKECYRACNKWESANDKRIRNWTENEFLFGLNLRFNLGTTTFTVQRFPADDGVNLAIQKPNHKIAMKVSLMQLDEKRNVKIAQTSQLQFFSLNFNEKRTLLTFNEEITYPLEITYKVLAHTPH